MSRKLVLTLIALILTFAGAGSATAQQNCQGCACELFVDDLGADPCWSITYAIVPHNGTCVWDGPTCEKGEPCTFQFTWRVSPRFDAPPSCATTGLFGYTYAVEGATTQTGNTVANRSNQCNESDLRCDTDWLLEVENDDGGALVGAIAIVCHPCGIVVEQG